MSLWLCITHTAHELVAFQVIEGMLLHIHVTFIKEKDGVPLKGLFEDLGKLSFNRAGRRAQLAGADDMEWSAHLICHLILKQSSQLFAITCMKE